MLAKIFFSLTLLSAAASQTQQNQQPVGIQQNQSSAVPANPAKKYHPKFTTAAAYDEYLIREMLAFSPSLRVSGSGNLERMGDQASAYVLKIIATQPLKTTADLQRALDIVHASFEGPEYIRGAENHRPVAVLNLLSQIDAATSDPAIKSRIVTERNFVYYASVSKSLLSHSGDASKPPAPGPPLLFTKQPAAQ